MAQPIRAAIRVEGPLPAATARDHFAIPSPIRLTRPESVRRWYW